MKNSFPQWPSGPACLRRRGGADTRHLDDPRRAHQGDRGLRSDRTTALPTAGRLAPAKEEAEAFSFDEFVNRVAERSRRDSAVSEHAVSRCGSDPSDDGDHPVSYEVASPQPIRSAAGRASTSPARCG